LRYHSWLDGLHRAVYVNSSLLGPTMPAFSSYNPGYAQVQNEHFRGRVWGDLITAGVTPEAGAAKSYNRVEEIFDTFAIQS
jgi:hypothetical protein